MSCSLKKSSVVSFENDSFAGCTRLIYIDNCCVTGSLNVSMRVNLSIRVILRAVLKLRCMANLAYRL